MKKEVAERLIEKMEERKTHLEDKLPDGELKEKKLETIDRRIESFQNRIDQSDNPSD